MLNSQLAHDTYGYAATDKLRRPGLSRAIVVSNFPKLRSAMVKALESMFVVEWYASPDEAIASMRRFPAPGLFVLDYAQLTSQSRRFVHAKMEMERLQEIPVLVTGQVTEEVFNKSVHMACRTAYLKQPFLISQLRDEAGRLLDGPIEDLWKLLPTRQKEALQETSTNHRRIARRVRKGMPFKIAETRQSSRPLLEEILDGNAATLIENLHGHHNHTYVHSMKVATLLSLVGSAIGISGDELHTITIGGLLMDIGKIRVSPNILNCPEPLNKDQMEELRCHVEYSTEILKHVKDVNDGVRVIAEQHHERVDGSGYPHGLKNGELNELARLAAIADVFCGLTDERPYKPGMDVDSAFAIMDEMSGQLDPFMLKLFKQVAASVYSQIPLRF